jgi:hypothetical protein
MWTAAGTQAKGRLLQNEKAGLCIYRRRERPGAGFRIVDNGSITIISSAGGFGWEQSYALCKQVIACRTYEETIQWYEQHPETYAVQDVFLKERRYRNHGIQV